MFLPILLFACECETPDDGPISAGSWGGEHFSLVIVAAGDARLETDCAHGSLAPATVTAGEFHWEFDWIPEGGAVVEDGVPAAVPVAEFDGKICVDTITGTLAVGDDEDAVSLTRNGTPYLYKCL